MLRVWFTALALQAGYIASELNWPTGSYGLLKPATGCAKGWYDTGWIFQDTEDTNPSNNRSQILHIDGYVDPSFVLRYFCVSKSAAGSGNWPRGQYCIFHKSRLNNMVYGYIKMRDETTNNRDAVKPTTPYISNGRGILTLRFRCMKSTGRVKNIPIDLPTSTPFYLLPYGSSECQQVKWMTATTEWIKYHTNDYEGYFTESGTVPYYELGETNNRGITMYYCYYQSCNNTLYAKQGVFQSPDFPGEYPDGQLCSWEIPVSLNHTVQVHFTSFSLYEDDILVLYESYNKTFQHNDTFYGDLQPFTITTTSDVLFVFRSNEADNSYGFRAEYTIFIPTETTTAPTLGTEPLTSNTKHHSTTEHHSTTPEPTKHLSNNRSSDAFEGSRENSCDGTRTVVAIVIPLTCGILVVAIAIDIVYRCRFAKSKNNDQNTDKRIDKETVVNPTYERGNLPLNERSSTATVNTTINDSEMYQTLSRDQPDYEAPDYTKLNANAYPHADCGSKDYHEFEHTRNNKPSDVYNVFEGIDRNEQEDPMYHVLEGPNASDPAGSSMYEALDQQTTRNPLYESTDPSPLSATNVLYNSFA